MQVLDCSILMYLKISHYPFSLFCVSVKTCEKGFTYFIFNLTYIVIQLIVDIFISLTKKNRKIKEVAYVCLYVILFTMIFSQVQIFRNTLAVQKRLLLIRFLKCHYFLHLLGQHLPVFVCI